LPATTVHDVHLELSKEEAAEVAQGVLPPHKVSEGEFLNIGLDIEEQQSVSLVIFFPHQANTLN
jgi:hypothetical protein